jgi:iron complex transport system substrate-binding protein
MRRILILYISTLGLFLFYLNSQGLAHQGIFNRIISIDYCSDQYVLKFANIKNIVAVSKDSEKSFSYMSKIAKGIKKIDPNTEEILNLNPDLVVRSFAGSRNLEKFLNSVNIKILTLPHVTNIEDIKKVIKHIGILFNNIDTSNEIIIDIENKINNSNPSSTSISAIYVSPAGMTAGQGTLIDNLFILSGIQNFQTQSGWRSLPIERVLLMKPDLIVYGAFENLKDHPDIWNPLRHPISKQQLDSLPAVYLKSSLIACGGWFFLEALNTLIEARK